MEQIINNPGRRMNGFFRGRFLRGAFGLNLFLILAGCGSESSQLRLELDPTVAVQPHSNLVRILTVEFKKADQNEENSEKGAVIKVPVPAGLSSGQVLDLSMPEEWSSDGAGVWKVAGRGDDDRPLISGEAQTTGGQKTVTVILHDSIGGP